MLGQILPGESEVPELQVECADIKSVPGYPILILERPVASIGLLLVPEGATIVPQVKIDIAQNVDDPAAHRRRAIVPNSGESGLQGGQRGARLAEKVVSEADLGQEARRSPLPAQAIGQSQALLSHSERLSILRIEVQVTNAVDEHLQLQLLVCTYVRQGGQRSQVGVPILQPPLEEADMGSVAQNLTTEGEEFGLHAIGIESIQQLEHAALDLLSILPGE
jgi:hypothetical protein